MGLLDNIFGGGTRPQGRGGPSPLTLALLALLAYRAYQGKGPLGGMLGRGQGGATPEAGDAPPGRGGCRTAVRQVRPAGAAGSATSWAACCAGVRGHGRSRGKPVRRAVGWATFCAADWAAFSAAPPPALCSMVACRIWCDGFSRMAMAIPPIPG